MLVCKDLAFADCELKFADADAQVGTFEGYASVFDVKDHQDDIVAPGAYADSIKKDGRAHPVFMLFNHDPGRVIGKWTDLSEDSKGLHVRGEFTPGHTDAQNARASAMHEAITGLSVGIKVVNADKSDDGARVIKSAHLVEVSLVAAPANQYARVEPGTVKSLIDDIESLKDAELVLREAGMSKAQAVAFLARCKAVTRGEPDEIATLKAELQEKTARLVQVERDLLRARYSFNIT